MHPTTHALVLVTMFVGAALAGDSEHQASWLGNSFPGGSSGWVQMDAKDGVVTADGRLVAMTWYEEAHSEVAIYGPGPTVGGRGRVHANVRGLHYKAGLAIAADDRLAYAVLRDGSIQRIALESGALAGAPVKVADPHPWKWPLGAVVDRQRLYLSDWAAGLVRVLDAASLREISSFPVQGSRKITADHDGNLWLIIGGAGATPLSPGDGATVECWSPDGRKLGPVITDLGRPTALCVDRHGRIAIADSLVGRNHIRIYDAEGRLTGTFGRCLSAVGGEAPPDAFDTIVAIGATPDDGWLVAWNGGPIEGAPGRTLSDAQGLVVRALSPQGQLSWQVMGLGFTDPGAPDPADPDTIYTKTERYRLDLSQPRGQQWTLAGWTLDRARFPQDPRTHCNHMYVYHAARIDGRLFLLAGDQYEDYFTIYRMEGGTAVPCVMYANKNHGDYPPNKPDLPKDAARLFWQDGTAGNPCDGAFQADEFTAIPDAEMGWTLDLQMDARGDLWLLPGGRIVRIPLRGLDASGVPVYDVAGRQSFERPASLSRVRQLHFDATRDEMYLAGYTREDPWSEAKHGPSIGTELQCYESWSSGPRLRSRMPIPARRQGEDWTVSMAVCPPWVFAGERSPAHISIFDSRDGHLVRRLVMDESVGGPQWPGGGLDLEQAVRAFRRPDGEIMLLCEEVSYSKTMMHRWMPPDAVPKPPTGCRIAGGEGTCRLRWDAAFDGAAWYRIERSAAADGTYTVVADGILGRQWEDASAAPGTTWWYRVRGGGPAGVGGPAPVLTATAEPGGHRLPRVVITSPTDGTVQQGRPGRVSIEAADVAGLPRPHRVLWLVDGREVGQDQEPPWRHDIRNPQPGPLTITARPLDAEGFAGPDAEVSIAINGAPIRPRLRIVTPRDGAIFHHGSEIVIEVQASADTDGPIVCAIDGAIVAEFSGSPLRCTWKAERPGVHVVEVRATGTKTGARHGFAVRDR